MPIIIDRTAPEGNAFSIMATVQRLLRDIGRQDDWDDARRDMMSGDYEHLCEVAEKVSAGSIRFVN